ncbi:MAG: DUF2059 domain-containing protein [Nibricoccus sp.]
MKIIPVILLSCLALPVFASPETQRAKAEELYRLSDSNVSKYIDSKINDLSKKMTAEGNLPKEAITEVTNALRVYVTKHIDVKKIEEIYISGLEKDLTEEELTAAIEALKTPALQKIKTKMPALRKEAESAMEKGLQVDQEDLKEQINAILKKYR